jgi:hypothetical protein
MENTGATVDKLAVANLGTQAANCFPIISYFIFMVVYIVAFICIYERNVALLGVLLLYIINIIYSIFLIKDMLLWGKVNQIITFIIMAVLALNITSSSFIMMTLNTLHAKYKKENENIKLSVQNKARISKYFTMFICTIVFVWILAGYYFVEDENANFFNYIVIGQKASPTLMILKLFLKIALSGCALGLSAYMVFLANKLSRLKRSQMQ